MENKGAKTLAVIAYLMVFGMLSGQSTASNFQSCYESCFLLCVITPNHSVSSCSFKCLKDCILPTSTTTYSTNRARDDQLYFCKLRCASSLCSSFSTKQNPDVEKVGGCVDSCSGTCSSKKS